jgi:hypothetical protein
LGSEPEEMTKKDRHETPDYALKWLRQRATEYYESKVRPIINRIREADREQFDKMIADTYLDPIAEGDNVEVVRDASKRQASAYDNTAAAYLDEERPEPEPFAYVPEDTHEPPYTLSNWINEKWGEANPALQKGGRLIDESPKNLNKFRRHDEITAKMCRFIFKVGDASYIKQLNNTGYVEYVPKSLREIKDLLFIETWCMLADADVNT